MNGDRDAGIAGHAVTTAEEAVLDLAATSASAEDAVNWAIRACQRRKTTADLIGMYMLEPGHRELRWRADLRDALTEIRAGVHRKHSNVRLW